jgi:hypothetical protein
LSLWRIASNTATHVEEFEGRREEVRRVDPEVFQQRQVWQLIEQLKRENKRSFDDAEEVLRVDPEVMEHRQSVEQLKKDFQNDHRWKNIKLMGKAFDLRAVNREHEEVGGTTPTQLKTAPSQSRAPPTLSITTPTQSKTTTTQSKTTTSTASNTIKHETTSLADTDDGHAKLLPQNGAHSPNSDNMFLDDDSRTDQDLDANLINVHSENIVSRHTPTTDTAGSDTPTAGTIGSDTPTAETTGSDTPTADITGNDTPSSRPARSDTPSVSQEPSTQDTPSSITHFPTRKFPMVPPTSQTQKLESLHGITLEDCRIMHKLANRQCHSYEDMRFFSSDESSRTIALASFPGSGNTWVRLLIEQATGVFTGSVYNDKSLKCTGFLAEGIKGRERNEFVAVKTHENNGKWDAAIFLIRNPYKAIVSYYNLMLTGSHTMTTKLREIPDQLFMLVYGEWLNLWDFFIFNQTVPFPVHIVQYENLVDNFKVELEPMVSFLNQTLAPEKLDCLIKEKNDHYQRQKHASVNIFTEEQTAQIEDWITDHEEALTRLKINYKNWKWQP